VKHAVETTLEQARRMGAARAMALCECFSGALEFQAGHWAEAERALRDSIRLYREIGAASGEALACQRLGVLQTARGQLAEAMATFDEGISAAERALMRAHCLTRLYAAMTRNRLLAANLADADHYLTLGLEMGQRHGNCATCDSLLLPAAVSVRLAQRDFAPAEAFCRQLEEAAQRYGSRLWLAMARQTRGDLLAALGNFDEALACYAEAQAAYTAAGHDYEAARCLQAIAATLTARRAPADSERASAAHAAAQHLFAQLGAAA
jgi:predicted negative regulator of RcsB-dependent stress response